VESNFQGKNLPKLTSFISNQIRRSIRNKHTLPRYKVRYKPFFVQDKPQDGKNEVFVHNSLITVGKMDVEIVECTRLPQLPKGSHIYCTLSLDSLPWKEDMPMRRSLWPVHELLIRRATSGIIGLSVCQDFEMIDEEKHELVRIESVKPNSPASQVDIQRGDILVSVNNVDIVTIKQALRLLKIAGKKFTIKIQRPPPQHKNDDKLDEKVEKPVDETEIMASDNVSVEEAKPEPLTNNGVEDSFDYNSIIMDKDDSETEEFVNIVVHEIVKELKEDDNDEATQQLLHEVQLMRRESNLEKKEDEQSIDSIFSNRSSSSFTDTLNDELETASLNNLQPNNVRHNRTFSARIRNKFRRTRKSSSSEPSSLTNRTASKSSLNKSTDIFQKSKKKVKLIEDKDYVSRNHEREEMREPLGVDNISQMSYENEWDNISQQQFDVEEGVTVEEEKEAIGQKTALLAANQEPVWNEIFAFDVEKEHKFLNVCVWAKCEDTFESDVLLGYVSIPLMELAMECFQTASHKSIQTFFLSATASKSNINRTYLRVMMPGLNLACSNGDITLAYKYNTAIPESDLHAEEMKLITEQLKRTEEVTTIHEPTISTINVEDERLREHNFVGTEFYFPTRCDYCQNKVWRKVAFQCRVCAMVSHKRCMVNAQNNTYCTLNGVRAKPPVWQNNDITQANDDETTEVDNKPPSPSPRTYPFNVPDELDLRPGIKNYNPSSNVLRRRNLSSKKLSPTTENGNIFEEKENSVFLEEDNLENDVHDSIATAAVTAKEAGRELFASLEEEGRERSIQKKVEELQFEIQKENEKEAELRKMLPTKDDGDQQKVKALILKSEERCQGLKLLMIQYCSALEECFVSSQQCDL